MFKQIEVSRGCKTRFAEYFSARTVMCSGSVSIMVALTGIRGVGKNLAVRIYQNFGDASFIAFESKTVLSVNGFGSKTLGAALSNLRSLNEAERELFGLTSLA